MKNDNVYSPVVIGVGLRDWASPEYTLLEGQYSFERSCIDDIYLDVGYASRVLASGCS